MEKSSQLPKPEDCSAEGALVDLWFYRSERLSRSVSREKREPQAGPASGLSNSASKELNASGDGVSFPEPNTEPGAKGESGSGLPGSQSVARAEGSTRNEGGPESPCRTNCASQAGREAQRQEAPPGTPGVGLAYSSQRQGASPEAGQGANSLTKSTQATNPVRLTGHNWLTFLWAKTTCQMEEPGAGKPPAGICEGGIGQLMSLPRQTSVLHHGDTEKQGVWIVL